MQESSFSHSVCVVAPELSSGEYLRRALREWRSPQSPLAAAEFFGVFPSLIEKSGEPRCHSLLPAKDFVVMGLWEAWQKKALLKDYQTRLVEEVKRRRPLMALMMDYGGFNLRLAPLIRPYVKHMVYWIPPQVWAWRKHRLQALQQNFDHLIVHFPFEKRFYESQGVSCHYFGHPLWESYREPYLREDWKKDRRGRLGIEPHQWVIGLLPGSREQEWSQHWPILKESARQWYKEHKNSIFLMVLPPSLSRDRLGPALEGVDFPLMIHELDQPAASLAIMDMAWVASGTVTLQLALLRVPQIIFYRVHPVTAWLLKFVKFDTRFFGLPHIVLGEQMFPELYQGQFRVDTLLGWSRRYVEFLGQGASTPVAGGAKAATFSGDSSLSPILTTPPASLVWPSDVGVVAGEVLDPSRWPQQWQGLEKELAPPEGDSPLAAIAKCIERIFRLDS